MAPFTRDQFLLAATTLLEDIVPSGPLGLGDVPIRELTAAQRLEAVEIAKVRDANGDEISLSDGTAKIDNAIYRAALIQMALLDPATALDATGALIDGAGTVLLQPSDIFTLAEHGKEALTPLGTHIINLSWMTARQLFRNRPPPDDRQPDTGAGAGDVRGDDVGYADARVAAGDDGAAVGAGAGDTPTDPAEPPVEPALHA